VKHASLTRARTIIRRQHGAISVSQVRAAGVTRQQERGLVGNGEWERAARAVIVAASSPDTWLRRAMVVTLVKPGRLSLSHRAAAHLLGFDGFRTPPRLEVVGDLGCRLQLPLGATMHRSQVLGSSDLTRNSHIPTTNAATTLCQLAQVVAPERVAQALDHVLRSGSSPRWLRETGERLRRRGLHGPNVLLKLLEERVARRLPRSWFERLAEAVFAWAGIELEHEHAVRDASGRMLASLDLADPPSRVGVECQSWEHHGSPGQQYSDVRRRRLLRQMGWEIVEVWWWDLGRPEEVVADVLRALLDRNRGVPGLQGNPGTPRFGR
jgi:hypothetical protein